MAGKILLNVLYNIALITLIICLLWSVKHGQYIMTAAALFAAALITFLKLRLIKEVKEIAKKRP